MNKEVEKAQKELEAENQKALETLKPSFWKGLQLVGSGTIGALAYTQQVKNAINKLNACRANLEKAQSEKNSVFRALTISGAVDASITQVNSLIGKALKELEAMAGIWSTLCKDFDTLLNTLNSKGVKEISKILTKLAVQSAIRQWEALRDKAKAYRDDAYSSGVTWYPTIDALLKAVG